MREFAQKAVALAHSKTRYDLENDEVLLLALTHLLELIGEAASQIPADLQEQYPVIPWPKIISMRNRLIHGYDYFDVNVVWETVTLNLPELLSQLDHILGEADQPL